MKTKKIILYYSVTTRKVLPPKESAMQRKEEWLRMVQASVPSDYEPKQVKVTYQLFNPEVEQQRKYFNGPVVEYFGIQHEDKYDGRLTTEQKKLYRETILDWALGYDVPIMGGKMIRRRKSSSDFVETQQWSDFLNTLQETIFDQHGFEFPDTKEYFKLAEAYGHEKAKTIAIEQLQRRMRSRNPHKNST